MEANLTPTPCSYARCKALPIGVHNAPTMLCPTIGGGTGRGLKYTQFILAVSQQVNARKSSPPPPTQV